MSEAASRKPRHPCGDGARARRAGAPSRQATRTNRTRLLVKAGTWLAESRSDANALGRAAGSPGSDVDDGCPARKRCRATWRQVPKGSGFQELPVTAIGSARPGAADRRRGTGSPWVVFPGLAGIFRWLSSEQAQPSRRALAGMRSGRARRGRKREGVVLRFRGWIARRITEPYDNVRHQSEIPKGTLLVLRRWCTQMA
jgi:hypothetical protein